MAEFKKYLMKDQNDYRPDVNNHEVALIKSSNQGDWAYGRFSITDEDMKDMTDEEFVTKYQEIIDSQEFARSEIGRLEQLLINIKGKI